LNEYYPNWPFVVVFICLCYISSNFYNGQYKPFHLGKLAADVLMGLGVGTAAAGVVMMAISKFDDMFESGVASAGKKSVPPYYPCWSTCWDEDIVDPDERKTGDGGEPLIWPGFILIFFGFMLAMAPKILRAILAKLTQLLIAADARRVTKTMG
jgi:hypothetical protein